MTSILADFSLGSVPRGPKRSSREAASMESRRTILCSSVIMQEPPPPSSLSRSMVAFQRVSDRVAFRRRNAPNAGRYERQLFVDMDFCSSTQSYALMLPVDRCDLIEFFLSSIPATHVTNRTNPWHRSKRPESKDSATLRLDHRTVRPINGLENDCRSVETLYSDDGIT